MTTTDLPGGTYTAAGLEFPRTGYGAMQLAGPGVLGPPKDHENAIRVLRTAVELGIRHIDTADFYGPHVVNDLIREALHPYPEDLLLVTKVGNKRDSEGGWPEDREPDALRRQVHDNLRRLGVDVLDVVNLRMGGLIAPEPGPIASKFEVLEEMRQQGLIRHLGLSNVTYDQVIEAQAVAPIVCVQNLYNIAHRQDDALIDYTARQNIAFVPYFPLGGFTKLQSATLDTIATSLDTTPHAVALAWLLQRSPNTLLIPGTSSITHLHGNIAAAALTLPATAVKILDDLAEKDEQ
ncbi:oxidoreductase [Amycolatopsis sp. GM8]|uniref:oxidoreductase n=1 Tax=Amycolatopsis sp. GM8 TaxID=2896530 RepID=UPI001F38246A|nr:oxidoreductase [Amycolatopsis sp. GM8]